MKRLKYLSIFIILSLIGFYIGSQSEILGQGLFFAEVEDRGPASSATQLEELFSKKSSLRVDDVISMASVEGADYCDLLKGLDEYTVHLRAEGVTSGDKNIELTIEGDCLTRGKLVVFDASICMQDSPYKELRAGVEGLSGVFIRGHNLDNQIPVRALEFYVSHLSVSYNDGKSDEKVEAPLGELKELHSCAESFK